jgi:hypothetical protein
VKKAEVRKPFCFVTIIAKDGRNEVNGINVVQRAAWISCGAAEVRGKMDKAGSL